MKHTKEPWKIDQFAQIVADDSILGNVYCGDVFPNENLPECTANAQRIIDCVNALAGIENPQEFVETSNASFEHLKQSTERIKSLKEAGSNLLQAMNQYSFFVEGYAAGSASISECNHANDELNKAQNALFELLKTQ